MCTVEWWTHHHTGHGFACEKLPITRQDDGFSCGLLAYNALTHWANPEKYPLIDATKVDDARLEILLGVIIQHLNNLVSILFIRSDQSSSP